MNTTEPVMYNSYTNAAVEKLLKSFEISDESLRTLKLQISKEFELGLRDEDQATIKMLITYVRELSRGDESGSYLALDLGGTHFRVLLIELENGHFNVINSVHDIPSDLLVTTNGQDLFDYIALKLLEFVQQHKLKRRRISLGFTFSFPCKQYGLTQSILVKWCKGFNVGGVIGTDVVKQLKDALKRQLAGLVEAYIDVVAVINDTTGTLVACANSNKNCRIGLIVGTGFNACYIERLDKCEKWPANYTNPKQVIINCEWGAMGDHKERRELDPHRNEFDTEVDAKSVNPGNQTYEKMTSGMYIGELLRLCLVKLYKQKLIFTQQPDTSLDSKPECGGSSSELQSKPSSNSNSPAVSPSQGSIVNSKSPNSTKPRINGASQSDGHRLYKKDVIDGRHMSMLAKDELSHSFEETKKVMIDLNVTNYTETDMSLFIRLASKIMHRSAHLAAAGISALLERINKPYTVIGYDGSVIKHHPYYLKALEQKCALLTPSQLKFEFLLSSDGSGIGAAVVAAALHKERRPLYVVKPGKLYELHYSKWTSPRSSIGKEKSATRANSHK